MKREHAFQPSLMVLENRWLPTVGPYPDAVRNAIQASFVAQAEQATNPVVFLGDSITHYWGGEGVVAPGSAIFTSLFAPLKAANFGISGDTTQELLERVEGGDLDGKPKVAVVMIGVNDLIGGATPEEAASGITAVVQAIRTASPSTKILVLGVLPTDIPSINPEIVALDSIISGLGQEAGVTFMNPGTQFLGANGNAKPNLLMDVVHPDAAGYQILANAIDGTILDLLNSGSDSVASSGASSTIAAASGESAPKRVAATPVDEAASNQVAELIPLVGILDASNDVSVSPSVTTTVNSSQSKSFATMLIDVQGD